MLVRSVDKLFRLPNGTYTVDPTAAGGVPFGARVVWTLPSKGTQDFLVTQLPNNITTVAGAEGYLNAVTGTNPEKPDQTRLGVFFDCYAVAKIHAFQRNTLADFEVTMSTDYLPLNYFG